MMHLAHLRIWPCLVPVVLLAACQVPPKDAPLLSKKSPVELRAMEARVFETGDRNRTLRAVIATLQDLGYAVEKVEAASGTVSGTKLAVLKMSASVYPRGASQMAVRANALVHVAPGWQQVDAPEFYKKDFFDLLSKTLFLDAETISAPQSAGSASPNAPPRAPAERPTS